MDVGLVILVSVLGQVAEGQVGAIGIPGALTKMELSSMGRGSHFHAGDCKFITPPARGGSGEELAGGVAGIDDGLS